MVADGGTVPGREGTKIPAGTVLYVCTGTVRYLALEIAYKKFTGDFGLDFLAHLRNQVGARQGSDF